MKVFVDSPDALTRGSVCAIGSFDGVHVGHQAIVRTLHSIAGSNMRTGIITFLPLPFFVLKDMPPMYLTIRSEKERLFASLGMDFIHYYSFDRSFAALQPNAFVKRLIEQLVPAHVVVGTNFHFGTERSGSAQGLLALAHNAFHVHIVTPVERDGIVSSTRIRELLLLGNVTVANELLGREYSLTGRVVRGKGRGSELGFPTVNVYAEPDKLLPLDGIYAAHVVVNGTIYNGALFLRHDLVEVHMLDCCDKLYEHDITIGFVKRIRSIERFPDDKTLATAIRDDVSKIRTLLEGS
ncbi:riboflavin biosynthesis protein RibF [candidate division WOR-3 bacterium]|nr:riboflavin biosynthesis protein RibF [candidate division WOR-3 bacterium]